ncbi:MAG: DUF1592 domain-containing protein [Planctomycetota bacterium]
MGRLSEHVPLMVMAVAVLLGASLPAQHEPMTAPVSAIDFRTQVEPVLAEFCFRCHGEKKQKGGIRLDGLDTTMSTGSAAKAWHAALDMIHGAEMPPDDEPQLSDEQRRLVVSWLNTSLDAAALLHRGERRVVMRRLTRDQYTNSLQDVLSVPIDFGQVLPADGKSAMGFSNNGEVLQASPLHLDYYQVIARQGLDQAIAIGERPPVTRYRVTFGKGRGKGLVASETGGFQSVPLSPDDFVVEILDAAGKPVAALDERHQAELDDIKRHITVGLRGSSQDRFRIVDEGMILLSALPHKEQVPAAWQGPSPNLKLEMQRCWPQRGDFVMRVRASRGYVPPLRQELLVGLDEPVAMAVFGDDGEICAPDGAIVIAADKSEERKNLRLDGGALLALDVPKPSQARLAFRVPADGFYQVDLVHPPVAPDAMPSVRLNAAGHRLDQRVVLTTEQLQQPSVITALGAMGLRAGDHHLDLGGPFFVGFSHVVISPMPAEHGLVRRLTAGVDEQNAAVANLVPSIRALMGTRTDDGMDYKTFGEVQEVRALLGHAQTYEFFGRLENLPIPEPDSADTEILSGFLLLGLWNDHLVKSPKETGPPLLVEMIEFEAPYVPVWPPRSHTDIFFASENWPCGPTQNAPNVGRDVEAYTREVVTRFVERAFRRPLQPGEVERYLEFWRSIRSDYDVYENGVREVLVAILCSPNFLYLAEPEAASGDDVAPPAGTLSQHSLASRLSFFLWNSPPDETLRHLAEAGKLSQQLLPQVDRLLDDPRCERFVRAFAYEWLRLDRHADMAIDVDRHPDYTRFVKRDMAEETYQFVHRVVHDDLDIASLIDSDFAMLNQNLAEFYGIDGVVGAHFRPVPVRPEQHRGGLLNQGAFLVGHSNGSEPHPIKRAVWFKTKILGDAPPPPPPNVPILDPETPGFDKLTLKQQIELHRDHASCRDCHAGIDPFGVPFERLSAVGRFEVKRKKLAIDASSRLPDGTVVDGVEGLQAWVLEHKRDAFARSLIGQLFAYALGRDLHFADQKEVDTMLWQVRLAGYRMRSVIRSIVSSPSFTQR